MEENKQEKMNEVTPEKKEDEKEWDQKATDDLEDWIEEQGIQLRY